MIYCNSIRVEVVKYLQETGIGKDYGIYTDEREPQEIIDELELPLSKYKWDIEGIMWGEPARELVNYILDKSIKIVLELSYNKFPEEPKMALWLEKGKWIAADNKTQNCWVEEFDNLPDAYLWVTGQIELNN